LYISVGDVCGGTVGASSGGASCDVISSGFLQKHGDAVEDLCARY